MKLLTLFFKNINSLEGESLIDFQKKPLAKGGVFAITGPNGSGKSSILDALSLAFYGETFRFDRPADYVMTHNAIETFAQVEFSLNDKKYRSRWQVNRQNNQANGALSDPIMQLFSMDGKETLLESSVRDVSTKISDIMGMDFHNFSRSILLAQGDFSAFLNALDNERMDILEKMSSQDIYAAHKQQLETKQQQTQIALEQVQKDLKTLPVMSVEEAQACSEDLEDFEGQIEDFQQQKQQIGEQLARQKEIDTLSQQLATVEVKQTTFQKNITHVQQKLEYIKAAEPAKNFKEVVSAIDAQQQKSKQSQSTLRHHQQEAKQLQEKQAQLPKQTQTPNQEQQTQQLKKDQPSKVANDSPQNYADQKKTVDDIRHQVNQKNVSLKTEETSISLINKNIAEKKRQQTEAEQWINAHSGGEGLQTKFPETQKLKTLTQQVKTLNTHCSNVEKEITRAQTALEKIQERESAKAKQITEIKEDLATAKEELAQMMAISPLAERQQHFKEQQQRTQNFKELHALAKVNQRVTQKSGFLGLFNKKEADKDQVIALLTEQATEVTRQIGEAQFLRNTLEKAIINESLLEKMQQDRQGLESGKPCPLCGSLSHPFAKKPPKGGDSQKALRDQKNKLKTLVTEADKIKIQIFNAEKQKLKSIDKRHHIQKNQSHWQILSNKLNVANQDMEMDNFSLMKTLLKKEETELRAAQKSLITFQKQEEYIQKMAEKLVFHSEKSTRLKDELKEQCARVHKLPLQLSQFKERLQTADREEKALSEKTNTQLKTLGEEMPKGNQDAPLRARLQILANDYKNYQEKLQRAEKSIATLEEKRTQHEQNVEQLNKAISENFTVLKKEEAIGLQLAQAENQTAVVDQEHAYQQEAKALQVLQSSLTEQLHDSPFANLSELKEALTLITEKETTEKKHADFQQQAAYLETEYQQLHVKLAEKKRLQQSDDDLGILVLKEKSFAEKISITREEIRHLKTKQQQQTHAQQRQEQLTEKLQQQQKKFDESSQNLQQSQENGIVFRRRVQLKMSTQLLSQTNAILEKISGRYYLRQAPSDNGLALEIEDTKLKNSRRSPESLSGGERFVVSLALALGLSELANNGKSVDFLFLDEGFGNLDSESLYTVISTLQSLQTQGKTVGVISHVEGIQKRIKTRIEMVKKPNGLSKLKKIA